LIVFSSREVKIFIENQIWEKWVNISRKIKQIQDSSFNLHALRNYVFVLFLLRIISGSFLFDKNLHNGYDFTKAHICWELCVKGELTGINKQENNPVSSTLSKWTASFLQAMLHKNKFYHLKDIMSITFTERGKQLGLFHIILI
jgi:hypothetical protein